MEKQTSEAVRKSLAAAALAALGFCNSARAQVVLSAVYGDGAFPKTGNPYFQYDYIELYNTGSSAASLNGLWLDMSGFATEPIAYGSTRNEIPLPTSAAVPAGGYYLIQINNGTSSPGFTNAYYTAPTPDLKLVYSTSQAGYSAAYGNPGWTLGNLFSEPYFQAGKIALVTGGSNGTLVDYVGYGSGLSNGTIATGSFGTNTYWAGSTAGIPLDGYWGTEYAGYDYYIGLYGSPSAIPTSAGVLGSSEALVRDDLTGDNDTDWTVEDDFTLTNSAGVSVEASPEPVPEPATAGLLAVGSALMLARRRSRQR